MNYANRRVNGFASFWIYIFSNYVSKINLFLICSNFLSRSSIECFEWVVVQREHDSNHSSDIVVIPGCGITIM